jgi:hypothetical protein
MGRIVSCTRSTDRLALALLLAASVSQAANVCDPTTGTNCAQVAAPGSGASTAKAISVAPTPKSTYGAGTALANSGVVVAAASAAPFACITGSASKTVILQRIYVSGATLTAVQYLAYLVSKYNSAASGGTAQAMTAVPYDSTSAAASASVTAYTAAPTAGSLVGVLSAKRTLAQATTAAAVGIPDVIEFDFRTTGETSGIYLRGTSQQVCVHFGAAPASAVTLSVRVEWTEQPTTLEP